MLFILSPLWITHRDLDKIRWIEVSQMKLIWKFKVNCISYYMVWKNHFEIASNSFCCTSCFKLCIHWCAILIAHQIVMAKHGGSCVHFSGISTCGRTSRETVSHSQRQPLPTPHKIALPVYVIVTNKRLQPLTTTLYNSLVLSFSLLTTKRRLIKHRSFLRVLRCS